MVTTRLLTASEFYQYKTWLKKQDSETRSMYFGAPVGDYHIDTLVDNIAKNPQDHNILVAEHKGEWVGTIHLAGCNIDEIEFGVIVAKGHRGHGIAARMLGEAILWARNRGYRTLYMHCLSWNQPIKKLCIKHGLILRSGDGESETKTELPPADIKSITQEYANRNRNVYRLLLQSTCPLFAEIYG